MNSKLPSGDAIDGQQNWLAKLKTELRERLAKADIGLRIHATVFVAVNGFLFLVNMLTSRGFPWFYFPLTAWAVGLLSHYQTVRNKRRSCGRLVAVETLTREQLRIITRIHKAEGRYRNHRAAFLSGSVFLIGTNYITSPVFPWFVFPVGSWLIGFVVHRAAHRAKLRMLTTNLEGLGVSWRAFSKTLPLGPAVGPGNAGSILGTSPASGNDGHTSGDKSLEYAQLLAEVAETRGALLQLTEANEEVRKRCGPDFQLLLDNYTQQIDTLVRMNDELEKTLSTFSQEDLETELTALKSKHQEAESDYVRNEYTKTIQQYERQKASLSELKNQKEVIHLRLTGAMLSLKQMHLDLSHMSTMSSVTEPTSVKLLREKSDELSGYLEDLRQGYHELGL